LFYISKLSSLNLLYSSSLIWFIAYPIANKFLHSPLDPFAIYKNLTNCLFDCNSKPSAILLEIDNAALSN